MGPTLRGSAPPYPGTGEDSLMPRSYQTIAVECQDDVFCVSLKHTDLTEPQVQVMGDELASLLTEDGCRKMVLSLGPTPPSLIYSVFMGKLLMVRRRLLEEGGALKLCEAGPAVRSVFDALQLTDYFDFYPDREAAVAAFWVPPPGKS
jgi:hypothetical protein